MEELIKNSPIGFFDSGVGGLSVLKKAIEYMPEENYIYLGDSANAPYGVKSIEEIKRLTLENVEFLLGKGVKAIVVACNTATSVAIEELRVKYTNIPIIGIEPALKPAVELQQSGRIVIMATNATLKEKKFKNLMNEYSFGKDIYPLPCPGLVEFVENGILNGERLEQFLKKILEEASKEEMASIVLGCTHYPFVKETIQKVVGEKVTILDGSLGTVKELKRKLIRNEIKQIESEKGYVKIYNTLEEKIKLSHTLINA
ncbi:glutamate racemase [Clostridium sp. YIM B02551]|uniref:glutamate racemase n=1 Tax=Clostridium sp. YIM B02551 TaxID=2910679 RepID=UPI001EECC94E|nr:glutamate racemase [Clostridium sp. YIM B02551]